MEKLALCCATGILASGCAGAPQIDRASLSGIHTIAVLSPADPATFDVVTNIPSGVAIVYGIDRMRFDSLMRSEGLTLAPGFGSAVAAELNKDGYEARIISLPRTRPNDFVPLDELQGVGADAVIDIRLITAGYIECSTPSGLAPNMTVSVRLVSPKTGKNVYLRGLPFGCKAQIGIQQDPSLVANAKYAFPTYEELSSRPALAAEGLRSGIPVVAALIGRALAK